MILKRGLNCRSYTGGESVHNLQIERLWLDLFNGCTGSMYDLFIYREEENYLNLEWRTQYTCLPSITFTHQKSMFCWKMSNNRNMSHEQLWVIGLNSTKQCIDEPIENVCITYS